MINNKEESLETETWTEKYKKLDNDIRELNAIKEDIKNKRAELESKSNPNQTG